MMKVWLDLMVLALAAPVVTKHIIFSVEDILNQTHFICVSCTYILPTLLMGSNGHKVYKKVYIVD